MPRAKPSPHSKMLSAICINCGEVIYKLPHRPWGHDDPHGSIRCEADRP